MTTVATGASISFQSGFFAEIQDITMNLQRVAIPASNMSTTGGHAFVPGSLYSGTLQVSCHYGTSDIPIAQDSSACVVTVEGGTTWSFDAFITSASVRLPIEDARMMDITLQIDGSNTGAS